MTAPLVSVLVPCYNAERFVGAALESVLAQTYAPIEVIVVDDGSTDRSAAVLEPFRAPGVTVIRQENHGAAAARNAAFAASRGRYILYLDGDDLMSPGHIAALVDKLDGSDRVLAMSQWDRFRTDPHEARFPARADYRDAAGADWLVASWSGPAPMMQSGQFLIPRSLIEQLGGWDERLSLIDDFEFFTRLIAASDGIRYAPGARLHYRSGIAGSLSRQATRKAVESACLSLLLGTGHLLAAEDSPRTRAVCAAVLQGFDYDYYPAHPDLRRRVRQRVAERGGARGQPSGPPGFHRLRRYIGWKAARRVQHAAEYLGLNGVARKRRA